MKRLAGTMFVRNGIQYDYCFMEAIESMLNFCDAVFLCDAGSDDGTLEILKSISDSKFNLIERSKEEWDAQYGTGKAKLCYFTDIAISEAEKNGYEYSFYCQADEVIHENSYNTIIEACEMGHDAYMIRRINLWGSPYFKLNVEQHRLPCSEYIVRLAKSCYRSYGDAESLAVDFVNHYFANSIKMYHMGFVRDPRIMKQKAIHMQEGVFEMSEHDKKLDKSDIFMPELWFSGDDLVLIDEPLPKSIKEWAKNRAKIKA